MLLVFKMNIAFQRAFLGFLPALLSYDFEALLMSFILSPAAKQNGWIFVYFLLYVSVLLAIISNYLICFMTIHYSLGHLIKMKDKIQHYYRVGLGCQHFFNETSWNILNARIYFNFNAAKGSLTLTKSSSIISLWFRKANFSYDIQFIAEGITVEIQRYFSLKIAFSVTSIPWWSDLKSSEKKSGISRVSLISKFV